MTTEQSIRITNPSGLHARPAVKLTQLVAAFNATIQLRVDDSSEWIKARSVAKVMKLKAAENAVLHFRAEGEQAEEAVSALIDFVRRNFDEEPIAETEPVATPAVAKDSDISPAPKTGEAILEALTAAEGLAAGVLYPLAAPILTTAKAGTAKQEQQALQNALQQATDQLTQLAERADAMAAEIIAFQQQLLSDSELLQPVYAAIDSGHSASAAWRQIMDAEIQHYRNSDNEYFKGRATDLRDLRDRVLVSLSEPATTEQEIPADAILIIDELTPSRFLEIDWSRYAGAVTRYGSYTGHVAMLARARKVPLLIQAPIESVVWQPLTPAILVAERNHGRLIVNPSADSERWYQRQQQQRQQKEQQIRHYLSQPAHTADGAPIKVYINVDDPMVLRDVDPAHCDGIGLTRSEFLFYDKTELPDEETQYESYRGLLDWAQGRPVTIRTLDAGGDKPIAGLTIDNEGNPFLGVRGVRLSLARAEIFSVQLRALLRAAVHGPLKIMLPMVTIPAELEQTRQLLQQALADLQNSAVNAAMPSLGIMVEVPAAALSVDRFEADFLSIGSNDLIQYLMAAGRDCADVATLQDPAHPAFLELLARIARNGAEKNLEVSICGEMAAIPEYLPLLIEQGINTLSVPPAALATVKAELAQIPRPKKIGN